MNICELLFVAVQSASRKLFVKAFFKKTLCKKCELIFQ